MKFKINVKILKMYNKLIKGNNFKIQPVYVEHENKNYYFEAAGFYSHILKQYQNGDHVTLTLEIESRPKKGTDSYWTNINIVDVNKEDTDESTIEKIKSMESSESKEDEIND